MGVPITYIKYHNASQFEIIGAVKERIEREKLYRKGTLAVLFALAVRRL